jgi:hypothetical protein
VFRNSRDSTNRGIARHWDAALGRGIGTRHWDAALGRGIGALGQAQLQLSTIDRSSAVGRKRLLYKDLGNSRHSSIAVLCMSFSFGSIEQTELAVGFATSLITTICDTLTPARSPNYACPFPSFSHCPLPTAR